MSDEQFKRAQVSVAIRVVIWFLVMGAIAAWGAYSKLGIHAEQISRSLDSVVGLAIGAIASFLFAGILLGYALGVRHSR